MKVILLRHAQQEGGSFEEQASLSLKGRYQQEQTNKFLQTEGHVPDLILTSPIKRAEETAHILHKAFQCPVKVEKALGQDFRQDVLREHIHKDHVMTLCFVGHSPTLIQFAKNLVKKLPFVEINRSSALVLDVTVTKESLDAKVLAYVTPQGVQGAS